VEDLKARIQTERDVPADRQRIIYKGKVTLIIRKSLEALAIITASKILVILRFKSS
jgi:hypothetical protein